MIVRVAEQALKSGASRVICAVDDELILKACEANGIEACLTRKDHACGTDRLCEAAEVCKIPDDEIIVNVQGDEPLIPPKVIKNVAELLMNHSDCSMGTAAIRIHSAEEFFNPNVVKSLPTKTARRCISAAHRFPGIATASQKTATRSRGISACAMSVFIVTAAPS